MQGEGLRGREHNRQGLTSRIVETSMHAIALLLFFQAVEAGGPPPPTGSNLPVNDASRV